MTGKLIVIEGTDGCGKETQASLLTERLLDEGRNVFKVTFPDYESDSSALVKMYLSGEFGEDAEKINPYAAATFYAVDRYASFLTTKWGRLYKNGALIIADRYVTSNMAYQAAKIADKNEKEQFLEWLWDLEFIKFALPVPDKIIFLDLPPEHSARLVKMRFEQKQQSQNENSAAKDIHEASDSFLANSYQNYLLLVQKYGWKKIDCFQNGKIRPVKSIHADIYNAVRE